MQNGLPFSILLVDDDEDDRLMIDEAFLEIGYDAEVKKFIDGKMLLQYLAQIEPQLFPSLIVLDNTLPGMDATELLRILKETDAYRSIRVIVYSTTLTPLKKEQLLAAGAYDCIVKGNTMENVIQIATYLRDLAEHSHEQTD